MENDSHKAQNTSTSNTENTYFLDTESAAEMARLIQLDMVTTSQMGGPLAEQPDPSRFSQVLDLACGPGGWVLSVAQAYPHIEVAGIDISKTMIDYANARARSEGRTNASFGIMDVTRPLDLPNDAFDLVNGRLMVGFLHRNKWPQVLKECFRISKPGGVLRLTEMDFTAVTTSPAYNFLDATLARAFHHAGYGFSPDGRTMGMTPMLPTLLRNAGYQNIHYRPHVINFSADADSHMAFYRNYEIGFKLMEPFVVSTGVATQKELDQAYETVLNEMRQDDFKAMWYFLTIWGTKPA